MFVSQAQQLYNKAWFIVSIHIMIIRKEYCILGNAAIVAYIESLTSGKFGLDGLQNIVILST